MKTEQPPFIILTPQQFESLEQMRAEFLELKRKVDALFNKPTIEWVNKAYLQKTKLFGVKDLRAVTAKLDALVAEKHIRQQGRTYSLTDIQLFLSKTQA